MLVILLGARPAPAAPVKTWNVLQLPDSALPTRLLMPVTSVKPRTLELADLIFQDRFQFVEFLNEVFVFPGGRIDYDAPAKTSPDSNYLWMQSLTPISHLCNAYEIKRDVKYLKRALPILEGWEAYAVAGQNKFLWYDHSAANRTHTLIYLYVLADREKLLHEPLKRHLVELLARHCEFLADPKNYTQSNHGVMMDRALLLAALFIQPSLPEETRAWRELALARLRQDFQRDFTPSMVHIENSPAYHFNVSRYFEQIGELLAYYHAGVPEDFASRLRRAEDYGRLITMPNGNLPLVGDTNDLLSPTTPSLASAVHPDAGVAVFCAPSSPTLNSAWMMFKSGYLTWTHKHADDLSFLLYGGGQDIFPGGGVLNYQELEPSTRYIKGALAHNTLVVDGKTYELQRRTLNTTAQVQWTMFPVAGLSGYEMTGDLDWVTGFNDAYPGVRLERTVVFLKPDLIVLYDSAVSSASHQVSQFFRIARGLRLARLNDQEMLLAADTGSLRVSLLQLLPAESAFYDGDKDALRGYAAFKFDTLTADRQVEFSLAGARGEFLTAIGIDMDPARLRERLKTAVIVSPGKIRFQTPRGAQVEIPRRAGR